MNYPRLALVFNYLKLSFMLLLVTSASTAISKTVETRSLGWVAGQDITQNFVSLFTQEQLVAGDTLVFDAMYQIQGTISIALPPNITLAGAYFGAGLTVRNTEGNVKNGVLKLADNNRLFNLTMVYKETLPVPPESAGITIEGKSNTRGILAFADNITIDNSVFRGNVGIHIDASGRNLSVSNSHFDQGYAQLRWLGSNTDHRISRVLFENSLGDGIKTTRGGSGTVNARIDGSVFLNNRRDGIDTTGGFADSEVNSSYFVNLFKGLDIKNIFDQSTVGLDQAQLNKNITVRNSTFVDVNNGLAPITLDRGNSAGVKWITNANADQFLTQRIVVENCAFQSRSGNGVRAILATDVHTVNWSNLLLIGNVSEVRVTRNPLSSGAIQASVNTNYNISGEGTVFNESGENKPDSFYRSLAGPDSTLRFGNIAWLVAPISLLLGE